MKSLYLAASLALIAVPAHASDQTAQSNASAQEAKAAKETKYCLTYEVTVGSRLSKSECKTKAQWAKEGVNIDHQRGK